MSEDCRSYTVPRRTVHKNLRLSLFPCLPVRFFDHITTKRVHVWTVENDPTTLVYQKPTLIIYGLESFGFGTNQFTAQKLLQL
jgi:hypothetical protein